MLRENRKCYQGKFPLTLRPRVKFPLSWRPWVGKARCWAELVTLINKDCKFPQCWQTRRYVKRKF